MRSDIMQRGRITGTSGRSICGWARAHRLWALRSRLRITWTAAPHLVASQRSVRPPAAQVVLRRLLTVGAFAVVGSLVVPLVAASPAAAATPHVTMSGPSLAALGAPSINCPNNNFNNGTYLVTALQFNGAVYPQGSRFSTLPDGNVACSYTWRTGGKYGALAGQLYADPATHNPTTSVRFLGNSGGALAVTANKKAVVAVVASKKALTTFSVNLAGVSTFSIWVAANSVVDIVADHFLIGLANQSPART